VTQALDEGAFTNAEVAGALIYDATDGKIIPKLLQADHTSGIESHTERSADGSRVVTSQTAKSPQGIQFVAGLPSAEANPNIEDLINETGVV
jgi:hypothetical protein